MKVIESKLELEQLIKDNQMILVYFGSTDCSVCNVLKPKVTDLLNDYHKIDSAYINVNKSIELSASFNIFTIPAILVFIDGKEIIREARHISIRSLNNKLSRYYNMLFE